MLPKITAEMEAEICNKLDQLNITMFGRRIHHGPATNSMRTFYDIHPYPKQGTGVSCTLIYTDEATHIPYVLLAKKKNKNQYDQIGGYTHGQGPEGSDNQVAEPQNDKRDFAEETMIGNQNAVTINENELGSLPTQSSLKELKEAARRGFFEQQSLKLAKKIDPIQMKESFKKNGIIYHGDYNAWETALREVKEETGLDLSTYKPKELYTSDDFGISNEDERLHTKTTHYLFYLGKKDNPPLVKAGSDVEQLKWLPVTEIELNMCRVKNDLAIRKSYLLQTLVRALKKVRELELAGATESVLVKYKSLGAYHFSNPFCLVACQYHQQILAKATRISKLMKVEIENNMTEKNNFLSQP